MFGSDMSITLSRETQLALARVKLQRAEENGGTDPVTGYTVEEIRAFIANRTDA